MLVTLFLCVNLVPKLFDYSIRMNDIIKHFGLAIIIMIFTKNPEYIFTYFYNPTFDFLIKLPDIILEVVAGNNFAVERLYFTAYSKSID